MEGTHTAFEAARKRRIELHAAMAGLESALARASAATDWRVGVIANLVNLAGAYDSHIDEVESETGILADLLSDAPRMANYVAILKHEHLTIAADLDSLIAIADEMDAKGLRDTATSILGDLVRHRQLGADLVWDAAMLDIGGQSGGPG